MIRRLQRGLRLTTAVASRVPRTFVSLDLYRLAVLDSHPHAAFHLAARSTARSDSLYLCCMCRHILLGQCNGCLRCHRRQRTCRRGDLQEATPRQIQHPRNPPFSRTGSYERAACRTLLLALLRKNLNRCTPQVAPWADHNDEMIEMHPLQQMMASHATGDFEVRPDETLGISDYQLSSQSRSRRPIR